MFTQHTDDIACVALHPNGLLAATGQVGAQPFASVWSTVDRREKARLHQEHGTAHCCLAVLLCALPQRPRPLAVQMQPIHWL
jgi:hypothetical protein